MHLISTSAWLDCYSHAVDAHVQLCMYMSTVTEYVRVFALGQQHCVVVCGVPFLKIVLFLPVGLLFIKNNLLTCIWTQISIFPQASTLRRDNS